MNEPRPGALQRTLTLLGPGILVAATGVGAGDLATAAFSGARLGVGILWAVLLGAALKFVLSEGIARWQLATDTTVIEGAGRHLGRGFALIFLPYLIFWSFFVASALMSACAVATRALLGSHGDGIPPALLGAAHGILGVVLVLLGGFRLFEKVMSLCIGLMFLVVVVTAACFWPGLAPVLEGLFLPQASQLSGESGAWTIALMGGVGGTVTILCYGYWIRELGRRGKEQLTPCRIDLGVGYAVTAIFGLAMVIIGTRVPASGKGAALVAQLGNALGEELGPIARWSFLVGAWGAIFSSLLGVWQAVPSIFADTLRQLREPGSRGEVDPRGLPYRGFLLALSTVPIAALGTSFKTLQKAYAVVGAAFLPLLAIALLLLLRRRFAGADGYGIGGRVANGLALAFFLFLLGRVLVG